MPEKNFDNCIRFTKESLKKAALPTTKFHLLGHEKYSGWIILIDRHPLALGFSFWSALSFTQHKQLRIIIVLQLEALKQLLILFCKKYLLRWKWCQSSHNTTAHFYQFLSADAFIPCGVKHEIANIKYRTNFTGIFVIILAELLLSIFWNFIIDPPLYPQDAAHELDNIYIYIYHCHCQSNPFCNSEPLMHPSVII